MGGFFQHSMPGHLLNIPNRPQVDRDKKGRFSRGNTVSRNIENRHKFTHGHVPWNKDGEFAENIREKNGKHYWYIKYRGNWQLKHIWLWKQVHGEVKKGNFIVFKNGDTLDCAIENLEEITRAECMKRTRSQEKINYGKRITQLFNKYELPRKK